jgi:hypothetical protein
VENILRGEKQENHLIEELAAKLAPLILLLVGNSMIEKYNFE